MAVFIIINTVWNFFVKIIFHRITRYQETTQAQSKTCWKTTILDQFREFEPCLQLDK